MYSQDWFPDCSQLTENESWVAFQRGFAAVSMKFTEFCCCFDRANDWDHRKVQPTGQREKLWRWVFGIVKKNYSLAIYKVRNYDIVHVIFQFWPAWKSNFKQKKFLWSALKMNFSVHFLIFPSLQNNSRI